MVRCLHPSWKTVSLESVEDFFSAKLSFNLRITLPQQDKTLHALNRTQN